MPYALYSTTTGIIQNVLYQQPTSQSQLAALTAAGLAFVSVPVGTSTGNSIIDLATNAPVPNGPAMTQFYKYSYDTTSGMIMHTVSGAMPLTDMPNSSSGVIWSTVPLPLSGGMILTLDGNGNPTQDASDNYIAAPYVSPPQPPDMISLMFHSMVTGNPIDTSTIPPALLTGVNASLATQNIPAIIPASAAVIPAAPSSP
jgi:hypothetical protein